jgi:membrane dipeptidase
VKIVGEDQVGIGTDFTQGYGDEFFRYISHDKGYGRKLVDFGQTTMPVDFVDWSTSPI